MQASIIDITYYYIINYGLIMGLARELIYPNWLSVIARSESGGTMERGLIPSRTQR